MLISRENCVSVLISKENCGSVLIPRQNCGSLLIAPTSSASVMGPTGIPNLVNACITCHMQYTHTCHMQCTQGICNSHTSRMQQDACLVQPLDVGAVSKKGGHLGVQVLQFDSEGMQVLHSNTAASAAVTCHVHHLRHKRAERAIHVEAWHLQPRRYTHTNSSVKHYRKSVWARGQLGALRL